MGQVERGRSFDVERVPFRRYARVVCAKGRARRLRSQLHSAREYNRRGAGDAAPYSVASSCAVAG